SGDTVRRFGLEPLAHLLSVGTGFEQKRIKTQTVCIGEGLTAAFRTGLSGLPAGTKVTDIYCDLNGSRTAAKNSDSPAFVQPDHSNRLRTSSLRQIAGETCRQHRHRLGSYYRRLRPERRTPTGLLPFYGRAQKVESADRRCLAK